jgi:hypothetical protein
LEVQWLEERKKVGWKLEERKLEEQRKVGWKILLVQMGKERKIRLVQMEMERKIRLVQMGLGWKILLVQMEMGRKIPMVQMGLGSVEDESEEVWFCGRQWTRQHQKQHSVRALSSKLRSCSPG